MNESTATRHQRLRRRAQLASLGVGGAWLLALGLTGLGRAMALWAWATPWPVATFALTIAVGWEVLAWPVAVYAATRDRRRLRRGDGEASVTMILARDVAIGVAMIVAGAVVAIEVIDRAETFWWLAAGVLGGFMLIVATAGVGALVRSRAASRPLSRASLASRVDELSARVCGVSVPVREWEDGEAEGAAMVTGVGRASAILLSRDLGQEWPEEEVVVVVAHELAHHRRRDLWRKAALDALVLTTACAVADQVMQTLSLPIGSASPEALATLPVLVLAVSMVWWLLRPLRLAQSRGHERTADALALEWTGRPDALRAAIRRMSARHLSEERPSRWVRWFFHKHPTVEERLSRLR